MNSFDLEDTFVAYLNDKWEQGISFTVGSKKLQDPAMFYSVATSPDYMADLISDDNGMIRRVNFQNISGYAVRS